MSVKHNRQPPQPKRFGALELDMAPDVPGIYAWYAKVALSERDWEPRLRGDRDLATFELNRAIMDYVNVHRTGPVHMAGPGKYGLNWSATLNRESAADLDEVTETSRLGLRLAEVSANPEQRRLLADLLLAASPIFASPLYIGVATNLRGRLAEHKKAYEAAYAQLRQNPALADVMQFNGQSLGERLAGCGIRLERLDVWVLPSGTEFLGLGTNDDGRAQRRVVAQNAEWVLQRVFQPVLGRQ
ncbi:hypothetical protein CH260_24745 [Rhodococcus sp. 05-2256-B2]|uniref:hypothetical protein n=1 Tax=unclassified Rhodococcus (in: high G+C Gram-positive bacteria) TaxID=192944 RepID=UPI000B9C6C5C|nr:MULTISPECIES: hypothetical protein [unclassified Rhodococcus (in: high G+C Gram-positive bacteria)]OZD87677.1 hypothetical protein CH258_10975 [Rhodococcus sp. 05-2256-B4]OZD89942.1 hypothetical protein CH260_24745 [Rhodococcus sp. 05-2256-B2]OZD92260.1 hypothetical protein CH257_14295 [Rhodococcus sp. 05-2256-B3]OZD98965.1 hypothetical protein CH285_22750 [Rhodococcus sp. 05-2256-B1]